MPLKEVFVMLILIVMWGTTMLAQGERLSVNKLKVFLPTAELETFERGDPAGSIETDPEIKDCIWTQATVVYNELMEDTAEDSFYRSSKTIFATIADYGANTANYFEDISREYNEKTSSGYSRSVKVSGRFSGRETVTREAGEKSCLLEFVVANRYKVILEGYNTDDIKLLYQLAGSMNLAKLEKAI